MNTRLLWNGVKISNPVKLDLLHSTEVKNNPPSFLIFRNSLLLWVIIIFSVLFSQTLIAQKADTNIVSDTVTIGTKSPTGALVRSAILPGLGQFYNEAYWKIPIIYGLGAFFIY
jgi:hypothetical protein